MTHHEVHEVRESHVHEEPPHTHMGHSAGGGGYFSGSMAWIIAMVLVVLFALIAIVMLFAWAT
jgi:hypothetical protein